MTYYIFSESAGENLVNERYCNIPSISNASFGHKRSGSLKFNLVPMLLLSVNYKHPKLNILNQTTNIYFKSLYQFA